MSNYVTQDLEPDSHQRSYPQYLCLHMEPIFKKVKNAKLSM
jgi:hypothetical protein